MERYHADKLLKQFHDETAGKPIVVLGIPDHYDRDDPRLIRLLKKKVEPYLETAA